MTPFHNIALTSMCAVVHDYKFTKGAGITPVWIASVHTSNQVIKTHVPCLLFSKIL